MTAGRWVEDIDESHPNALSDADVRDGVGRRADVSVSVAEVVRNSHVIPAVECLGDDFDASPESVKLCSHVKACGVRFPVGVPEDVLLLLKAHLDGGESCGCCRPCVHSAPSVGAADVASSEASESMVEAVPGVGSLAPVPARSHIRLIGVPAYEPTDVGVEPGEAA